MTEEQILKAEERERQRLIKEAEKNARREQREKAKREKMEAKEAAKLEKEKPAPTEADLVRKYANRVIKNAVYHGRVDSEKFSGLEHTHSVSKNLWMDQDFFFSVVFQSGEQKRKFLEEFIRRFPIEVADDERWEIQILNGLDLAKLMGIELKPETTKDYPTGNLDLMPLVLDNEYSGNYQGGTNGQEKESDQGAEESV